MKVGTTWPVFNLTYSIEIQQRKCQIVFGSHLTNYETFKLLTMYPKGEGAQSEKSSAHDMCRLPYLYILNSDSLQDERILVSSFNGKMLFTTLSFSPEYKWWCSHSSSLEYLCFTFFGITAFIATKFLEKRNVRDKCFTIRWICIFRPWSCLL